MDTQTYTQKAIKKSTLEETVKYFNSRTDIENFVYSIIPINSGRLLYQLNCTFNFISVS